MYKYDCAEFISTSLDYSNVELHSHEKSKKAGRPAFPLSLFLLPSHAVDGRQTAINGPDIEIVPARLHVFFQFPFDTLQCVIDGFNLTMQVNGNLLVGLAVEIAH